MAYTVEQFLTKIKPYVIADMKNSGILASLTAAQALIESNKGNSGLAIKGNNLFGIKGKYNGQSVNMLTTEYYNGVPHKVNAEFRKYPSWAESIADHSGLFNRQPRYSNLRGCTDWVKATDYVQKDGYATSPTYTQTLQDVIKKYRLYTWDDEVLSSNFNNIHTIGGLNRNPYKEPIVNVKLNTKGNNARWLQYELNKRGYKLIVDGNAGPNTINALKDFQLKNDLVVDGVCGEKTRQKLKTGEINGQI